MVKTWLFPYQCLLCKCRSDQKRDLCSYCEKQLTDYKNRCAQCGLWLEETEAGICGHCLKFPPAFERVIVASDYFPQSSYLLQQFKFHHRFAEGKVLAALLAQALKQNYQDSAWPDVIVPVPLHYKRLFSRGFNQALLLAKNLKLPIKIDYRLLKRVRHTPRQALLSGKRRRRNLKGHLSSLSP
jgi:ComF family protein